MSLLSRSSFVLRQGLKRSMNRTMQARRGMGGGGHPPFTISEVHTQAGEIASVFAWLWFLHRARMDGPVLLGWRHPWEHADDGHHGGGHEHSSPPKAAHDAWDSFSEKALKMTDDDDDEDEEDEEEDDEDDE